MVSLQAQVTVMLQPWRSSHRQGWAGGVWRGKPTASPCSEASGAVQRPPLDHAPECTKRARPV